MIPASDAPPLGDAADVGVAATVVVPLHNNARYVGELLGSLFEQWRPEFELLLIDDASTDDGFGVAQSALARHPDVRATVMRTEAAEGMGLVARIVRLSRGRVLISAHSDDIALPGRLDAVMACFAGDPDCRLVTSNALLISPESRAFGIYDSTSASGVTRDLLGAAALAGDSRWLGATTACHRDLHERFPPLDPELCPYGLDLLLPFRAVLLGSHHYLAEPLVGWRQHGANTHRVSGHYGGSDDARERYRALNVMVLAQKVRDAAFLAGHSPSPRLDEVLRRCRQRFDAEFDGWCRMRSRAAQAKRGAAPGETGHRPGVPPLPTLAVGETLRFARGEFGAEILAHHPGFHAPEERGTWTKRVAHLSLRVVDPRAASIRLQLRLLGPGAMPPRRVRIRVGAGGWTEVEVGSAQPRDVELRCAAAPETRVVDVTLLTPDAVVPAEVDPGSSDSRLLGVGLLAISAVRDVPSAPEPPRGMDAAGEGGIGSGTALEAGT